MAEEKKKEEGKERENKKDLLELLLSGEQMTEKVNTKRGPFVLALPFPKDIRAIEITVATRLNGQPASSFTPETIANIRCYATLDAVIVDAPEWWNNLASSEDCPDDDLVLELYRRYLRFYKRIQDRISKSRFRGASGIGRVRTASRPVDTGTFSGIADG